MSKCFSHLMRGQQLVVSTFGNVFGRWQQETEASDSEFTGYKTQIELASNNSLKQICLSPK